MKHLIHPFIVVAHDVWDAFGGSWVMVVIFLTLLFLPRKKKEEEKNEVFYD